MSRYYKQRDWFDTFIIIWYGFWILFVVVSLCIGVYRRFDKAFDTREVTVIVTDKAVKNNGESGKYLIFTEDMDGNIQVFEITDSLLAGRFDSSDVYAAIKIGSTYTFTVGGSRNEFMSWYPNIYEYKLIK